MTQVRAAGVRLDRMFVRATPEDRVRRATARLIAEGVEDAGDLAHVVSLRCDHVQGDYGYALLPFEKIDGCIGRAALRAARG